MNNELNLKQKLAKNTRIVSLVFGFIWLVNAILKWQPAFLDNFTGYLQKNAATAPPILSPWLHFWVNFAHINPTLLAFLTAIVETLIAISLLFGIARKPMYIIGFLLSFGIWATAEGAFARLYKPGATDVGTSIIYCLVFAALWGLEQYAGPYTVWTLDEKIAKAIPAWKSVGMFGSEEQN